MKNMDDGKGAFRSSVISEFDVIRQIYHHKFGELAAGKVMLKGLQEAMQSGNHAVNVRYSQYSAVQERLDRGLFDRLRWAPYDFDDKMMSLVVEQWHNEFQFRRSAVRRYIRFVGLEEYTDEIIGGMNRTSDRVVIWPDTSVLESENVLRLGRVLEHDSGALLDFALDYVDKWQTYHQLFGNGLVERKDE